MNSQISNYTGIGNTNNPDLVVKDIFSAVQITERTNVMSDTKKYSKLKTFNFTKNKDEGMELC